MTSSELRSALEPIETQLRRIADALALLVPDEPPMSDPAPTCPHPEEARIGLGTTNGIPEWECRLCRYRSSAP